MEDLRGGVIGKEGLVVCRDVRASTGESHFEKGS